MKALITGASSGFGRDFAKILSQKGYDIIAVARSTDKLIELKNELKTNVEIITLDVCDTKKLIELGERAKDTDILINNAGFGVFGEFTSNDLETELRMIETNIKAVHILTKLFVKEFRKKNSGYILNVASLAAFFPGPLFSAYYATKSYVLRLSQGISEELRREGSNVKVSVLCPGPAHTGFAKTARVNFGKGNEKGRGKIVLNSNQVSEYAIKKMFAGKDVIIPGIFMRIGAFCRHIFSDKMLAKIIYMIQSKKCVIRD